MIRRMLITLLIFAVPALVVLLFSYDVIDVAFDSFMEKQESIGYEEGPRLKAPALAVPVSRPLYVSQGVDMQNPVPADEVSLQRGEILYSLHCALCHGESGQGNGPVTEFWRDDARSPANLMSERTRLLSDGAIYVFITQGVGAMPPLRYNLSERQRWDAINYLRALQAQSENEDM